MNLKIGPYLIRPYTTSDIDSLVRHANNEKVARHLTGAFPNPYTKKDAIKWISLCQKHPGYNFAITFKQQLIGGIGTLPHFDDEYRTVGFGYWLGEIFWGKGIMTRVVKAFVGEIFRTRKAIARIEAKVVRGNKASQRVLEKAGFVYEGCLRKCFTKNGKTSDMFLYAKVRR